MKYLFASDIHGSAYYCRKLLEAFDSSGAKKMVLLGDILYHGPRNELPRDYSPKEVFAMLNLYKDRILAVRGNCDSEVDQMVLEFPMMADYSVLELDGRTIFATHGHLYHEDCLPPLVPGTVLIHGHTHVLMEKEKEGIRILNPGSVSIPKEGNPPTFGILEDGIFTIMDFEGGRVKQAVL